MGTATPELGPFWVLDLTALDSLPDDTRIREPNDGTQGLGDWVRLGDVRGVAEEAIETIGLALEVHGLALEGPTP